MDKSPWWKGNAPDFDWSVLGQVVYRHSCECVIGQTSSGTALVRRVRVQALPKVKSYNPENMSDEDVPFAWSGRVAFHEHQFQDMATFPAISRSEKRSVGRQGLAGGHLSFTSDGIHWDAGSILTPRSQIQGSFVLPWAIVSRVDVVSIPHKLNFLGGALVINFKGGGQSLHGEFLGPRKSLIAAIKLRPVGPSS